MVQDDQHQYIFISKIHN